MSSFILKRCLLRSENTVGVFGCFVSLVSVFFSFCGYLAISFVWHVSFFFLVSSFIFTFGVLSCAIGLSFSRSMVHKEIINYGRYR